METQTIIEYELVNFVQDRSFMTESRDEAIAYFEEGWTVYENRVTTCILSADASTQQTVTQRWTKHPNPEDLT